MLQEWLARLVHQRKKLESEKYTFGTHLDLSHLVEADLLVDLVLEEVFSLELSDRVLHTFVDASSARQCL